MKPTKQELWNNRPELKRICQFVGCNKYAIGNVNGMWVCREHIEKEEKDELET